MDPIPTPNPKDALAATERFANELTSSSFSTLERFLSAQLSFNRAILQRIEVIERRINGTNTGAVRGLGHPV